MFRKAITILVGLFVLSAPIQQAQAAPTQVVDCYKLKRWAKTIKQRPLTEKEFNDLTEESDAFLSLLRNFHFGALGSMFKSPGYRSFFAGLFGFKPMCTHAQVYQRFSRILKGNIRRIRSYQEQIGLDFDAQGKQVFRCKFKPPFLRKKCTSRWAPLPRCIRKPICKPPRIPRCIQRMIRAGLKMVGKVKYKLGGNSPSEGEGLDCSSLTTYLYLNHCGKTLPRKSTWQAAMKRRIYKKYLLRPGMLLFFRGKHTTKINHVALYIGRYKHIRHAFIHASNSRKGVILSDLDGSYWTQHFRGALMP